MFSVRILQDSFTAKYQFKNILGVNKLLNAKTQSHAAWINAGHADISFISQFLSINL